MHMPIQQTDRKRIGLTGDIRFRKQWFTRKMILQVAVIYEVTKWHYPSERDNPDTPFTTEVEWEDADGSAALRVMFRLPPFGPKLDFGEPKMPEFAGNGEYRSARKEFDQKVYMK